MDAYEIFKLLRTGVTFNRQQLQNEASKFKTSKTSVPPSGPSEGIADHGRPSHVQQECRSNGNVLAPNSVPSTRKRKKDSTVAAGEGESAATLNAGKIMRIADAETAKTKDGGNRRGKGKTKSDDRFASLGIDVSGKSIKLLSSQNVIKTKKKTKKKVNTAKMEKWERLRRKKKAVRLRKEHRINVEGEDVPCPMKDFAELSTYNVHKGILDNIVSFGYKKPTPIQMQAIPVMMQKREILGCAPTGSGKTAAFLIPIIHQLKEPKNLGFRAVIVEPTRELASQVYRECCRLAEGFSLRIHVIEKLKNAEKKFSAKSSQRFDILITTPKRLVSLLKGDRPIVSLKNVEWLVIDESDKLFESGERGFRNQLAVIYKACSSPYVRRAMFSATFAQDVSEWCHLNLDNCITVYIGNRNSAVETVEQELIFCGSEDGKLVALRDIIKTGFTPPVLVFVQSRSRAQQLFAELVYDGINVEVIHADRTEEQRSNIVKAFRVGKIWILICTELMGRGIDFKGVNLVVNYDFPKSAIDYIHRIGRTGRAGRCGKAVTFFTEDDYPNLRGIAAVIKGSNCPVPDYIMYLKKASRKDKWRLKHTGVQRKTINMTPDGTSEQPPERPPKKAKTNKEKPKKRWKSQEINAATTTKDEKHSNQQKNNTYEQNKNKKNMETSRKEDEK